MIFGLLILHPFLCKSSSISVPFTSSATRNTNVISAFACVDCWSTKRRGVCPSQRLFFDLQPPTHVYIQGEELDISNEHSLFSFGKKRLKSTFPSVFSFKTHSAVDLLIYPLRSHENSAEYTHNH